MPNATIYIRDEDWEDWQMLENKSDFIRKALERENLIESQMVREVIIKEGRGLGKLKDPETGWKTCKLGHKYSGDRCLQKGH